MKLELDDLLTVLGVASIVGGVAAWSRPAAAVVFGVFCLFFVLLIQRTRKASKPVKSEKGS
jgi:ABC-type transport system involved in cytochrome c biogenesis permease subunit